MRNPILIFFLWCCIFGFSQESKVYLSKNRILIGENVLLNYQIHIDSQTKPQFKIKQGVLPSFLKDSKGKTTRESSPNIEITKPFIDTLLPNNIWKGTYTITAWDSGYYIIPGPMITIGDSNFQLQDVELEVLLSPIDKNIDLYGIKEQFAELPKSEVTLNKFIKNNWWWILILVALIIYIFYNILKKSKNKHHNKTDLLPLKESTLLALQSLENNKLWEQGQHKEHFVELSYILRAYLSSRFEIYLLDKTTVESKGILEHLDLHQETIQSILTILQESDMVKFAKYKMDHTHTLKLLEQTKNIVIETSPLILKDA